MIDIKAEQRRNEFSITIAGHAQYAEPGKDIVCSAISALYENLLQSLEQLTSSELYNDRSEGWHQIYGKNADENAKLLLESFMLGCESVSFAYPDYVKCTYIKG